jgi:hypothetical protein
VSIDFSKNIAVDRNYVHGCFRRDTGGYCYGIAANWSTRVRITDNKLWDLRHNVLFQLGTNHSVVSYNSAEAPYNSYNDIALHANWAYMNLFEGNRLTEGYSDNSKEGQAGMEETGPYNTWFRNYATGQMGSINKLTSRQNLIGNKLALIRASGSDFYHGANMENGVVKWGSLTSASRIPASLYLSSKPGFLGGTAWPVYGPSAADWGASNRLPATNRPHP